MKMVVPCGQHYSPPSFLYGGEHVTISNKELKKELMLYNKERLAAQENAWKMFVDCKPPSEPKQLQEGGIKLIPELSSKDKKIAKLINTRWLRSGKVRCEACNGEQYVGIKYVTPYYVNEKWVRMAESTCQNCGEVLKWWYDFVLDRGYEHGRKKVETKQRQRQRKRKKKTKGSIPRLDKAI